MFRAAAFIIANLLATSVWAQSSYVSAAVGMDISRFDRVEVQGANELNAGGEALAFSLRLGTSVGENWGVELGFMRPSEVERETSFGFPLPLLTAVSASPALLGIPSFETQSRLERREMSLDTVAWVAQPVGSRVSLVYLGGIAFNRTVEETSFEFTRRLPGIVVPNSVRTITYDAGPVAGLEARIGLTDNIRLVPGLRLQSTGGSAAKGWLVRASAGLMWEF